MKRTLIAAFGLLLAACPAHNGAPAPNPPLEKPVPPELAFHVENDHLVLPGPIVFATGSYELDEEASWDTLQHILAYLEAKDDVTKVRIEGHTDGDSGVDDEVMMSGARATSVGEWLVAKGIDCHRLLIAAFGDSKPVADSSTPEGKAQNRRIEIVNAELRGVEIGGMPADGGALVFAPDVCE